MQYSYAYFTMYCPDFAWDGATVPDRQYFLSGGQRADISNNIFEFVAILAGLAIVARTRMHSHVHIYTDNTSALAWAQKGRGESGFHTFLLRVMCNLQVATGTHLTVSHVAGKDNVNADAISREFNVPNGPDIRLQVERSAPRVHMIAQLWSTFSAALKSPSPTPSETDHAVRTALEFVLGTSSGQRT